MTAQDYIQAKLQDLNTPIGLSIVDEKDQLAKEIYSSLTSKKFRKFSMSDELKEHIHRSIHLNIENNDPINITFLQGGYKLWRLDESPEIDWAELFALMRYIAWVKPVCELYKHGVVMDFFVDDYIVPLLNNVDARDIDTYISSFQKILDFMKNYKPANLTLTINTVGSKFDSEEAFNSSVYANLEKIEYEQNGKLPELSDSIKAMIDLNAKPSDEQMADPNWREKVWNLHNAYSITKSEPGYHKDRPEKILAFTSSLPMAIGVGTTKKAIMKYWVGAGVLRSDGNDFDQDILSPSQLENNRFRFADIVIKGLEGKNFSKIRIIK